MRELSFSSAAMAKNQIAKAIDSIPIKRKRLSGAWKRPAK